MRRRAACALVLAALSVAPAGAQTADAVAAAGSLPQPPGRALVSVGTGFFVDGEGAVLTNHHVVAECASVTVLGLDGRRAGRPVAVDPGGDMALVATPKAPPPAVARFSAAYARSAATAGAVIGFPSIGAPTVVASLTPVLAGNPAKASNFAILGTIRRGHSGSPVLDPSGLVIGVVRAKLDEVAFQKATGQTLDDVAIAISPQQALAFLQRHGIRPHMAEPAAVLNETQLLETGRRFVNRVECWR